MWTALQSREPPSETLEPCSFDEIGPENPNVLRYKKDEVSQPLFRPVVLLAVQRESWEIQLFHASVQSPCLLYWGYLWVLVSRMQS